jgi:hypothetical protein
MPGAVSRAGSIPIAPPGLCGVPLAGAYRNHAGGRFVFCTLNDEMWERESRIGKGARTTLSQAPGAKRIIAPRLRTALYASIRRRAHSWPEQVQVLCSPYTYGAYQLSGRSDIREHTYTL